MIGIGREGDSGIVTGGLTALDAFVVKQGETSGKTGWRNGGRELDTEFPNTGGVTS